MNLIEKIEKHLKDEIKEEIFTSGKSIDYLAGYMESLANRWIREIKSMNAVDDFSRMHQMIDNAMRDLASIQKRLKQINLWTD